MVKFKTDSLFMWSIIRYLAIISKTKDRYY